MITIISPNASIHEALSLLNEGDTLMLKNGIYHEKIKVTKNKINIIGEDKNKTIIRYSDYSPKTHEDGFEYNTFRTYTVMIASDEVSISNLTIENGCNDSKYHGQAVALHVLGNNFLLDNCNVLGYQDTLFTGPLPSDLQIRYQNFLNPDELDPHPSFQYYHNCYIRGNVDFIFGGGTCLFEACELNCIDSGYICAPSHSKETPHGFIFLNCTITSAKPGIEIKLARPWREYGKVVFINTIMCDDVIPSGFSLWNNTNRHETCFFAEYNTNTDTSKRVIWSHQLNTKQSKEYTKQKIFNTTLYNDYITRMRLSNDVTYEK